jgi:hypothetical protein
MMNKFCMLYACMLYLLSMAYNQLVCNVTNRSLLSLKMQLLASAARAVINRQYSTVDRRHAGP